MNGVILKIDFKSLMIKSSGIYRVSIQNERFF
jgi:hypothetical protein